MDGQTLDGNFGDRRNYTGHGQLAEVTQPPTIAVIDRRRSGANSDFRKFY